MPRPARLAAGVRNDPCPCGSGKKYKRCSLSKVELAAPENVSVPLQRRLNAGPATA